MTQLHRFLYCSRNLLPDGAVNAKSEIDEILARSRANNARDKLTGALLFSDGCFVQVLEGTRSAIEQVFERIQCDERHQEVTVLQSGQIASRDFPDWAMAFRGTDAAGALVSGDVLTDAFSGQSESGRDLLDLMKRVVVREDDWLLPV